MFALPAAVFWSYCAAGSISSTHGRHALSVAGLVAWNSLPDNLWDPDIGMDSFIRCLKTFLWCQSFLFYYSLQCSAVLRGSLFDVSL